MAVRKWVIKKRKKNELHREIKMGEKNYGKYIF